MALQRAVSSLRAAVLSKLSIAPSLQQTAAPAALQAWRGFADASYLDKKEVTDRVLGVVKNFEKVDASKVREIAGCWGARAQAGRRGRV